MNLKNLNLTNPSRTLRQSGQAVLIVTILACVIVLVTVSASLGLFNNQSSVRNITSKKVLQTYNVAMQGIQEALATRMVPRSNQLNFKVPGGPGSAGTVGIPGVATGVTPYYRFSGVSLSNVVNATNAPAIPNATNIMGVYRYVVVGGDAYRNGFNRQYYDFNNPVGFRNLVQSSFFPTDSSPFYIISNGITCVPELGTVQLDPNGFVRTESQLVITPGAKPRCQQASSRIQEITLLARVFIERFDGPGFPAPNLGTRPDQVDALFTYAGSRFNLPTPINAATPPGAFFPGVAGNNDDAFITPPRDIEFEEIWNQTNTGTVPRLRKFMFYNAIKSQQPGASASGTGAIPASAFFQGQLGPNDTTNNLTVPADIIPISSTLKLYFDGPIDFRSLYNYDIQTCQQTPSACNVRLRVNGAFQKINFVPVFPGLTSVVITPAYIPEQDNIIELVNLRTFNGDPIPPIQITLNPR